MKIKPIHATIARVIAGGAYFLIGESSIPKESNCAYLAPWTTDLLAWVGGAVLIYKGFEHDDSLVAFIGSTVASIHVYQFGAHKAITHRMSP